MARNKKDGGSSSGANWMDTYGDMVTLLLTFFVFLYSASSISEQKWQSLVEAFTGSYSTRPSIGEEVPGDVFRIDEGKQGAAEEEGEGDERYSGFFENPTDGKQEKIHTGQALSYVSADRVNILI